MALTKKCFSCDRELELMYFGGHGSAKDGLASNCRDCYLETRRKVYATSPQGRKITTERMLLGKGYDEFVRKIDEYRKQSEQY